ncbi:SusC/RagA family TonB-linked outer membrane protein [Flammeovirga kamogawensis]|uniref:TonB-dependent receptor n=1 Tax=Flammeovirga kamogawensis TaxID=373891 RepID=A0ABX8GUZ5_9BACT|nr:TonB-dependent receptor [Flammeovirga kamogawensis]MBB6459705.1 TonB-linked SusC/RagA family outer membrane protein [Flammeovirga kamogawensis]QWG07234.1 TonB-dependent receptor [Flammeovirga kamogawensis]TRX69053.1 TonB-dependent receptor [Flammeovirga kamogawensis]
MNNTFKLLLASIGILLFLYPADLLAQNDQVKVNGRIVNQDGFPLPGVSIIIKDAERSKGTISDFDGNFSLLTNSTDVLMFSFIGCKSQEVAVNGQSEINVVLEEELSQLDEIVVVGYGSVQKSHLTGAVSKVTNENLDQIPLSRVDDALAGQVSGVNIQMTNPEAGGAPTIRVRGVGSITSVPNPLIVVDGIVVDQDYLGSLDMNDVESIEVLKDASSAAIYGSRGSNGVILITNKSGKKGKATFTYNGYFGTKSVPKNDVLKTVGEWTSFVSNNNEGELTDRMKYINQLGTETAWDEVMMDGGTIQNHSLSARGGTEKTNYSASGSYLKDEGVLLTDSYEKINFRLSLDTKVNDRLKFGLKVNPSYSKQRRFPVGLHDAIRQSPWLPERIDENSIKYVNRLREEGRWADAQVGDYAMERMFDDYDLDNNESVESGGTDISTTSNASPLAKVQERNYMKYQTKLFTSMYLKYDIAKGLAFRSTLGGDYKNSTNERFTGVKASRNEEAGTSAFNSQYNQFHIVAEQTLTYDKNFGNKHSINAVAGFAYEFWDAKYSEVEANGYNFDYIQTIPATNVTGAGTEHTQKGLVSYLGRVNYAYDNKYLVSVSARTDGSSKFGQDNKFGVFPAASLGWRVSEEAFLKSSSVISNLKLRVSYGVTGNDGDDNSIGRYPHIGLVEPVGSVFNGNIYNGFNQVTLSNPQLQWEKSIEINPGVEVGFFQDKLNLSVDFYKRNSQDLLMNRPIPSATGFSDAIVNLGEVENKGIEVEVRTTNIVTSSFKWSTTGNVSYNENNLVSMAGADGLISTVDSKRPAEWIAKEGNPVASFYGYVVEKEIPLENIKNPYYPINGQSQDIYVKDLNGDGIIDSDDRTILGSPYPKFIWSVTNTMSYKNFDLSFMFQGSHGAKVRNMDPQYVNNQFSSNQDYITDETNPNFFKDSDKVVQRIFTDDIVMDASYITLRNLNIGYTLPKSWISKVGIKSARVYASGQNLIYIMGSDYRGYNPEGVNQGLDSPLTYGYQRGAAPIYRSYSAGINLQF